MSLLFPLYLAGLAAVAAPIVLHLIRRTPSGRTPFSSLMFLRVSPPRMVRRRSLDHLPLLLLRALVLALLALAFARPFLRGEERVAANAGDGATIVVLVDTSASMRAAWDAALREARAAVADAPAGAELVLASFDRELRWHVGPGGDGGNPRERRASARAALDELAPGWAATELGRALAEAADRLAGHRAGLAVPDATLVLVTDLQEGARLDELEDVTWPDGVRLEVRRVRAPGGNAGLHRVPRARGDDGTLEVRVVNTDDSTAERFELRWRDAGDRSVGDPVTVLCLPGESRVVRAPARPVGDGVDRLVLTGDGRPFDNVLYERPPVTLPLEVPSIGPEDPDARGLDHYLEHAVAGHPTRPVRLSRHLPGDPPALDPLTTPLVVVRVGRQAPDAALLLAHARSGGVVLAVLEEAADGDLLAALLDDPDLAVDEGRVPRGHALLGEIDFQHPLFRPFADPRYRRFTGVRFWRRRELETDARVLASFEDGAPFLVERPIGDGRVLVMTSSWAPEDGDLARSTRFAPLVQGLLGLGGASALEPRYLVGDPAAESAAPGHHVLERDGREHHYTVDLDPRESLTAALGLDALERFELAPATAASADAGEERTRQERAGELERRQQLWRWLVLAAVVGLLVETIWAGRLARTPVER